MCEQQQKLPSIFEHSDSIDQLAGALAAAQSEMTFARKDSTNPFLKSKYSDLASVWEAVRVPLTKNNLCVTQLPTGETLTTVLAHKSGQYIASTMPVKTGRNDARNDAQAYGSALTYARRYALSAIVGIAQDDDDGEGAGKNNSDHQPNKAKPSAPVAPKPAPHPAQTNETKPQEKKPDPAVTAALKKFCGAIREIEDGIPDDPARANRNVAMKELNIKRLPDTPPEMYDKFCARLQVLSSEWREKNAQSKEKMGQEYPLDFGDEK